MADNVTMTEVDWKQLVDETEGPEEEHVEYEFSNGREFTRRPETTSLYDD
jgi:hypothetical protein